MAKNIVETVTVDAPEPEALVGVVITPQEDLQEQEAIVRKGWKVAQRKAAEVYEALTIIYTRDLWKMHTVGGKRKYKAFDAYLFGEFGWDMSRARAHQIIREFQPKLVSAGKLDSTEIPEARKRTAPVITAAKAARVTQEQFQKALDAFYNRIDNTEPGEGKDALAEVYDVISEDITEFFAELTRIEAEDEAVSEDEKTATPAEVDETDADDGDDSEDEEADDNTAEDGSTVVGG